MNNLIAAIALAHRRGDLPTLAVLWQLADAARVPSRCRAVVRELGRAK